uniref:tRNA lysidine(34) synthetase TilS n=1 Tax=Thaumasiovibrio occultus TaxID=1891184 RepID=UPI000B359DE2|nr:tRNA lysidine(34) synthetase TilS [Thaumasiovibrio occultus]
MIYSSFSQQLVAQLSQRQRVVLALSGGLDSRVMLDLLRRFRDAYPQYDYLAVYVHHGLSCNADRWADNCLRWSNEAGIACVVEKVSVDQRQGGLEQGAREARYDALRRHITDGAVLLTAQHLDDQCETFLLALKRGSGPKGLSSMPSNTAFAGGVHLRPFLATSRDALEAYAKEHQLEWNEDESNSDTRFDRNFLRHQVMPVLSERWPSISANIARSARLCGEQEAALALLLQDKLAQLTVSDGLCCTQLQDQPTVIQRQLLRAWLSPQVSVMPSEAQLNTMLSEVLAARDDANPSVQWGRYQLRRHQDRLHLVRPFADVSGWQATLAVGQTLALPDGLGALSLLAATGKPVSSTLMLRAPQADEPITVRFAVEGLQVKPAERHAGRRKMKKLYQEYGIPSWQRPRQPMIFFGDELAAIAGLFVCEGFVGEDVALALKSTESEMLSI